MNQHSRVRGLGGHSPLLNRPERREPSTLPPYAPRLLNAKEASAYLGLKSRQALESVPVRPVKLGTRILCDVRMIDAWLDQVSGLAPSRKSNPDDDLDAADKALEGWMKTRAIRN